MNILLIQPEGLPGLKESRGTIPLSLLYLSAAVRDYGHTPHILDFSVLDVPEGGKARTTFLEDICNYKGEEALIGLPQIIENGHTQNTNEAEISNIPALTYRDKN